LHPDELGLQLLVVPDLLESFDLFDAVFLNLLVLLHLLLETVLGRGVHPLLDTLAVPVVLAVEQGLDIGVLRSLHQIEDLTNVLFHALLLLLRVLNMALYIINEEGHFRVGRLMVHVPWRQLDLFLAHFVRLDIVVIPHLAELRALHVERLQFPLRGVLLLDEDFRLIYCSKGLRDEPRLLLRLLFLS